METLNGEINLKKGDKKEIAKRAVELFKKEYPDAICSLNYSDAFQLLIATRLSAQCTDARVNIVTPALFNRFPTAADMAVAELTEVEELIKTCGLYKTKTNKMRVSNNRRLIVNIANNQVCSFSANSR